MHHQIGPVQVVISVKMTVIKVIERHNGPPETCDIAVDWRAFMAEILQFSNLIMISNADLAEISPPQGEP